MFNNIWNSISSNVWPFPVAILNLWAIFKVGGFIISVIIELFVKAYEGCIPDGKAFCAGCKRKGNHFSLA